MAQPKDIFTSLMKHKVVTVVSVIASLVIPIKVFFEVVPMPATKNDIHKIEKTQIDIINRIDVVTDSQLRTMNAEIDSLERSREAYSLQRLELQRRLNEIIVNKSNKEEESLVLKSLAKTEKDIRDTDERLVELRQKQREIVNTVIHE